MSIAVIGTDTGVGKTVTCAVVLARYGRRFPLAYWKPIATGGAEGRDTELVQRVCRGVAQVLPERYLFDPPVSPHLAARLARVRIEPETVLEALVAHGLEDRDRSLVVEGAGGLLVPLTDAGFLLADLIRDMHLPCLLVARTAVGTINHTLLTLEALRARRIEVVGVVLSGPRNLENRRAIERFGLVDVISEIAPIRPLGRAGVARAARSFDRRGRLARYFE